MPRIGFLGMDSQMQAEWHDASLVAARVRLAF